MPDSREPPSSSPRGFGHPLLSQSEQAILQSDQRERGAGGKGRHADGDAGKLDEPHPLALMLRSVLRCGREGKMEINRATLPTHRAVIVAGGPGHKGKSAHTFGKVLAGLNVQPKGRALGIFEAKEMERAEKERPGVEVKVIERMGRSIPASCGEKRFLALEKGKPTDPASVRRYLDK